MAKQLLFYENVVPVNSKRHKDLCIEHTDYSFAKSVNSVPLVAGEIPRAAREYTIVFAGAGENISPVAILGLEGQENLYVDADGKWNANYVPAFVRRYPFVFVQSEDGTTFTLAMDESWSGCNQEGRGRRLFDESGERSTYLSEMLGFLEQYQAHFQRTQAYCKKLNELGLLESMRADFTLADGRNISLGGFMVVNREKLKNLPAEKLAELAKTDELELTYIHLSSMDNFSGMVNRVVERRGLKGIAPVTSGEEAAATT
jgi:hypothetical protein